MKFYPYTKRGCRKRFLVVLVQEPEVLAILKGGAKGFHTLKWRGA